MTILLVMSLLCFRCLALRLWCSPCLVGMMTILCVMSVFVF